MTNFNEINSRQSTLNLNEYETVTVIGVGGIGSWVALNLALSGQVDKLIIIDPDTIEISNLNRTPFRLKDIGHLKIDAMKDLILERRATEVIGLAMLTTDEEFENSYIHHIENESVRAIIDCRDNIYQDMYHHSNIYYKVGYDGFNISIDGNPKETILLNDSTTNGYQVTPSFICPAQLAANLVVNDLLSVNYEEKNYITNSYNKLSQLINLNSNEILNDIIKGRNK